MVNADFALKAVMNTQDMNWEPSPVPGVERKYLDRVGGEVAIASTVVKYAANSSFTRHAHGGGEEIFVIKGVFYDEHDRYPTGTWIRSPRYSKHSPCTQSEGALIYVKTGHLDNPIQQ